MTKYTLLIDDLALRTREKSVAILLDGKGIEDVKATIRFIGCGDLFEKLARFGYRDLEFKDVNENCHDSFRRDFIKGLERNYAEFVRAKDTKANEPKPSPAYTPRIMAKRFEETAVLATAGR